MVYSVVVIQDIKDDHEAQWNASSVAWFLDLLPREHPDARIMAYAYTSNTTNASSIHWNVQLHADEFLGKFAVWREQTNTTERPILFIVHNHEGMILQQALCRTFSLGTTHIIGREAIQLSTFGVMIIGVRRLNMNGAMSAPAIFDIQEPNISRHSKDFEHLAGASKLPEGHPVRLTTTREFVGRKPSYQPPAVRMPWCKHATPGPVTSVQGVRGSHLIMNNAYRHDMVGPLSPQAEKDDIGNMDQSLQSMIEKAPQKVKREWKRYKRTLSNVAGKSPANYVPAPSRHFTGRGDLLEGLHNFFFGWHQDEDKQVRVLLHGIGGGGKTQIALKFAEENADRFWRIFWINANNAGTIEADLKAIALDDPEAKAYGVHQSHKSVLHWMSQADGEWLLVFDNADQDSSVVAEYLPPGKHGNVLITSLKGNMGHVVDHTIEVDKMKIDDAVALLLKTAHLNNTSDEIGQEAVEIVRELSFLPLAVDQAGTAIALRVVDFQDYRARYYKYGHELMRDQSFKGASGYGHPAYGTYDILFQKINGLDSSVAKTAISILETFAFLHSENIQEDIFRRAVESKQLGPVMPYLNVDGEGKWDEHYFRQGIAMLLSYSLIRQGGSEQTYAVHKLVHSWSRDRMSSTEQKKKCCDAREILIHSITMGESGAECAFRRNILPHIQANRRYAANANIPWSYDDREFHLFWQVYIDEGYGKDAEVMITRAVEWRKAQYGPEDHRTFNSQDRLVATYLLLEKLDEAEKLGKTVLEGRRKVMGREHLRTLGSMSNLAETYIRQRKSREAKEFALEALTAKKRVLGPRDPVLLPTMSTLATAYTDLGQWHDAERISLEVVEITSATEPNHPKLLLRKLVLVRIYVGQGKLDLAEELAAQTLATGKAMLGPDHQIVLMCMSYLGMVYFHRSDTTQAVKIVDAGLTIGRTVLDPDHPNLLRFQANLDYFRWLSTKELSLRSCQKMDSRHDKAVYRLWS
ncbi:hypothetical protein FPV67DRAFT_458134 [Lyophyllum atratum]|nr:hypothetical protein FPV67DRAFT_458134 [Lyophyllum atratum]